MRSAVQICTLAEDILRQGVKARQVRKVQPGSIQPLQGGGKDSCKKHTLCQSGLAPLGAMLTLR